MAKTKIAVLGPGAIGGLLAALFWRKGFEVLGIDKEENVALLQARGLYLESGFFGNFTAKPRFAARLDFEPDILFITTKAGFLEKAVGNLDDILLKKTTIVPLLNGLEHVDFLKQLYGDMLVVGTIGNIESFSPEVGKIVHISRNPPSVTLHRKGRAAAVARAFKAAGIEVEVLENERQVIWQKLLRLSALAVITAASGENLGYVRANQEWRRTLEGFLNEAALVATADGAEIKAENVLAQLDKLPEELRSSLQKDLELGRPNELDAIAGAIVRRGKKYGISCPLIERLIKIIEAEYADKTPKLSFGL